MMAFPSMIENAATEAGMPVGDLEDPEKTKETHPHWFVYCMLQLCRPITWGNHWENAKIIAAIPEDKLKTMAEDDFYELGFNP